MSSPDNPEQRQSSQEVSDADEAKSSPIGSPVDDGRESSDLSPTPLPPSCTSSEPSPSTEQPPDSTSAEPQPQTASPAGVPPLVASKRLPSSSKISVHLRSVGNAPVLKQKKFLVNSDATVAFIINHIKRVLKGKTEDQSVFVYVNQAFAPSPDTVLRNLFDCFGSEGDLVLHYSIVQAWG